MLLKLKQTHLMTSYNIRGGQGKREVGDEGSEGEVTGERKEERGGRRDGWRREKWEQLQDKGGREKRKNLRERSARRSKKGGGREGAGGGGNLTSIT